MMTKHIFCILVLSVLVHFQLEGQVGLLTLNEENVNPGYTLIYPHNQPTVFLINNCGQIVHQWEDDEVFRAGNTAYLTESGKLIKTKRHFDFSMDSIWAGGAGAFVECRSWDNELLWSFELNNEDFRLHHDIEPLPNGNVLMIAWESIPKDEAIELGRDPALITFDDLWGERIIEYDPDSDSIVWEWSVFDNVIQDFDSTKQNFGVVADHPEKIDINKENTNGREDWLHANSIDYNPVTDEVMLDVPFLSELWILRRGSKDEGFTFRWGNPSNYCKDTLPQKLFNPHDGHWIFDFLDASDDRYGKIAVFNNRYSDNSSAAHIINPYDDNGNYFFVDGCFGPEDVEESYFYPSEDSIRSPGLSSIRSLPGGNTLLQYGTTGFIVELTKDNEIVWEYKVPLRSGMPASRMDTLEDRDNLLFNATKYPESFGAFEGRDLSAKGYIEIEQENNCDNLTTSNVNLFLLEEITVYPNPANNYLHVDLEHANEARYQIISITGQVLQQSTLIHSRNKLDISHLEPGIYYLKLAQRSVKFVKI